MKNRTTRSSLKQKLKPIAETILLFSGVFGETLSAIGEGAALVSSPPLKRSVSHGDQAYEPAKAILAPGKVIFGAIAVLIEVRFAPTWQQRAN